ncbi:nudix hydrolase homolog 24 [Striga asiatica]|uniref:Nudix hydrolase homolog 24 n=1 Tax=Striga asiatica TaxID=4170 RepID=A0A5A7P1S6_STRAF|nr:nudix hydrolase homolog 24 [Striga asiatica]
MAKFPTSQVEHIYYRSSSNHHLLVCNMKRGERFKKKRFFFDRRWVGMEGINDVVEEAWMRYVSESTLKIEMDRPAYEKVKMAHKFYWNNNNIPNPKFLSPQTQSLSKAEVPYSGKLEPCMPISIES